MIAFERTDVVPHARRVRDALAVLKNFVRQPEKTFSTVSVISGHDALEFCRLSRGQPILAAA